MREEVSTGRSLLMDGIRLSAVTAGYDGGPDVVSEIDALLEPGLTLVSGANGSGKSTLLEIMASNLMPRSGEVTLDGVSTRSADARHRRSYAPHAVGLIPALTLAEHLMLTGPLGSEAEVDAAVNGWGLDDWVNEPIEALSTGTRRKAWLLMCLIQPQRCVLLDEPFNGLDAAAVAHLSGLIDGWLADRRTVVLASHNVPRPVRTFDPKVLRLVEGRLA
ncbi:ABC transporter ATP-binding protein [Microbacterium sp.]|uniref:ABC transporter ATP-binding protein n=1 Tax=Microbacterium sp. TaxID=51671 RepID=UPI003A8C097B